MRGRIRVVLADNAGCCGSDLYKYLSFLIHIKVFNAPPGEYDPMFKFKDFGGGLNKQSSVMYNVMTHVPSHRYLGQ